MKAMDKMREFIERVGGKEVADKTLGDAHTLETYLDTIGIQSKEDSNRYLVPDGKHLPVRDENGEVNHTLMGAAYASLHSNYRGHSYEGADKEEAIKKLNALYKSEGIPTPSGEKKEMDTETDEKKMKDPNEAKEDPKEEKTESPKKEASEISKDAKKMATKADADTEKKIAEGDTIPPLNNKPAPETLDGDHPDANTKTEKKEVADATLAVGYKEALDGLSSKLDAYLVETKAAKDEAIAAKEVSAKAVELLQKISESQVGLDTRLKELEGDQPRRQQVQAKSLNAFTPATDLVEMLARASGTSVVGKAANDGTLNLKDRALADAVIKDAPATKGAANDPFAFANSLSITNQ